MRIGINGKEAGVGQAYRNLDTVITPAFYTPGGPDSRCQAWAPLSRSKRDPDQDEFFLTFEEYGSSSHVVLEPAPLQPATPADLPAGSRYRAAHLR